MLCIVQYQPYFEYFYDNFFIAIFKQFIMNNIKKYQMEIFDIIFFFIGEKFYSHVSETLRK